ncbi:hypothetical protein, partial [Gluconobacter cadivus]|uniref:hypothetical protein n=1 Tax=Gluconobacter cadivus TaxID=2728101 RepID=UPI001D174977
RSSLNARAITVSINENGESQDLFSVTSRFKVQWNRSSWQVYTNFPKNMHLPTPIFVNSYYRT